LGQHIWIAAPLIATSRACAIYGSCAEGAITHAEFIRTDIKSNGTASSGYATNEKMKWMNANKTSLVEGGAPLGKTKRVDQSGTSNTKNEIGGYSVVQAESHDAATKIFGNDHPHLQMPGAWIEIIEIMPLPVT
jgi:hypothetical protein